MISCINANIFNTNIPKRSNKPSFGAVKPLISDTYILSDTKQEVEIKDLLYGRNIEANIFETNNIFKRNGFTDFKKFILVFKDNILGYITMHNSNDGNSLFIGSLYTEPNDERTYKGSGSELLKCAVKESEKRGLNGKLRLFASNGADSPLAFYYKNNFVVAEPDNLSGIEFSKCHNAAIHYAIQNNLPIKKVLPDAYRKAYMEMDENSAKNFLQGNRLYENRTYEKVSEKSIRGDIHSANLIQSPYNKDEYFLLVANDDSEIYKAEFAINLELNKNKNKNNKKHFIINDVFVYNSDIGEKIDLLLDALQKINKEKGLEDTTVSRYINDRAYDFCKNFLPFKNEAFKPLEYLKRLYFSFENIFIDK